jgi:prepilin-type N-terminal cleavage/methylation domain-containing protein
MLQMKQVRAKLRTCRSQQTTDVVSHGFSLIELLVVMAVMVIIMGTVFKSINLTQQKSSSEQVKLDLTQQAREFIDQITRDLRSAGYPNSRNMMVGSVDTANNALTDPRSFENGVGLIKVTYNQLWFAGDVDGTSDGNGHPFVKIIKYDYFATGTNCPCLRRTEYLRTSYLDPVADATGATATPQLEIQGIQNGTSFTDPIFTAYDPTTGTPVAAAIDFTSSGPTMAKINSLRIILAVQGQHKESTGAYPVTRVVSNIGLTNCSQAYGGMTLSC